jgi:hypothetical protein
VSVPIGLTGTGLKITSITPPPGVTDSAPTPPTAYVAVTLSTTTTIPASTVVIKVADSAGDVAVLTVPVAAATSGVLTTSATSNVADTIALSTPVNEINGNIGFSTTPTGGTVTEHGLPAGLVSNNPLVPGIAKPGPYNVKVTAKDATGAQANGKFTLEVNGTATKTPPTSKSYGPGAISNYYSSKCLDTAYRWYSGGGLVQWTCGSSGGANQQFELHWTGTGYELLAIDFTHPADTTHWVVTTDGVTGHQLTLTPGSLTGTPPTGQLIVRSGAYYEFSGTAQVINNAGYSTTNGSWVIGWPKVPGALNEQYSTP